MPKQFYLFGALFWTGIVLFFCLIRSSNVPVIPIENLDKLAHAFFHFVFTLLWFSFFYKQPNSLSFTKALFISFLFSFLFGILIEILQKAVTTSREGDVYDVMANIAGAFLAVLGVVFYHRFKKID